MRRIFLHGDQYEADRTLHYCDRCDLFGERDHFTDCPLAERRVRGTWTRESDEQRLAQNERMWRRAPSGLRRHVVLDAPNLFRGDS